MALELPFSRQKMGNVRNFALSITPTTMEMEINHDKIDNKQFGLI